MNYFVVTFYFTSKIITLLFLSKHFISAQYHQSLLIFANTGKKLEEVIATPLRERLHTHKVFTKDKCFYLNYHKFSIESYVVDVY